MKDVATHQSETQTDPSPPLLHGPEGQAALDFLLLPPDKCLSFNAWICLVVKNTDQLLESLKIDKNKSLALKTKTKKEFPGNKKDQLLPAPAVSNGNLFHCDVVTDAKCCKNAAGKGGGVGRGTAM